MIDLKTRYMGLELKNPIIIGASNLVTDLSILKELEKAGAAAIIYKSLFEEQIQLEELQLDHELEEYNERHAEMSSLFPNLQHAGPEEHLLNLKKVKEQLNIPVIASLNCIFKETWIEYAKTIEKYGADGLELNFYSIPKDFETQSLAVESEQIEIVREVKRNVKIPVSVKLSPFYTSPLHLIKKMDETGIQAFVLFNKLFQPDFNIDQMELSFPYNLSDSEENRICLRFAGLLFGQINADICANTGILSGKDVIKMILAGANSVQIVSAIYKNKPPYIFKILEEIERWMVEKKFTTLDDFRGKMSKKMIKDPYAYKRAQYVDILMKSDTVFTKYPLR